MNTTRPDGKHYYRHYYSYVSVNIAEECFLESTKFSCNISYSPWYRKPMHYVRDNFKVYSQYFTCVEETHSQFLFHESIFLSRYILFDKKREWFLPRVIRVERIRSAWNESPSNVNWNFDIFRYIFMKILPTG